VPRLKPNPFQRRRPRYCYPRRAGAPPSPFSNPRGTGGALRVLVTPYVSQRTERPRVRPRRLCVQGTEGATSGAVPRATTYSSSQGKRRIRHEVRSALTRQLPDAPVVRCVGCGGTRLIPLTFRGARRTGRSELPVRPNAKCVTCGLSYIGTQPLPRDGAFISLAALDDANRSAPWGRALAEWAVRIDSAKKRPRAETQNPADRTAAPPPGMPAVLVT
jgi:hypothetical protein